MTTQLTSQEIRNQKYWPNTQAAQNKVQRATFNRFNFEYFLRSFQSERSDQRRLYYDNAHFGTSSRWMSFIFSFGAVCGCPANYSFFLPFFRWTKSSISQNSFVSNGIVVLVSFNSQCMGKHTHAHAPVHSKNMSQDVFMALLLCSLTGKNSVCVEAAAATANFFHLRNFTWISVEIDTPHKWYPINASDDDDDDDDGDRNSSVYANKGYHIKDETNKSRTRAQDITFAYRVWHRTKLGAECYILWFNAVNACHKLAILWFYCDKRL